MSNFSVIKITPPLFSLDNVENKDTIQCITVKKLPANIFTLSLCKCIFTY